MDQLGSAGTYYPWGEAKGSTNPQDAWSYATYWRDSVTGLDYANQRYYSNTYGRFMTPDPYTGNGGGSGDPAIRRAGIDMRIRQAIQSTGTTQMGLMEQCPCLTNTALTLNFGLSYSSYSYTSYYAAVGIGAAQAALATWSQYWAVRNASIANLANVALQLKGQAAGGQISDCEGLAEFAGVAAAQDGSNILSFESDFQVLTPNSTAVQAVPGVSGQSGNQLVYLGNNYGQASGFQTQYQDSISPSQDQGHHFAAFLQIGYWYGATVGSWAAVAYENLEGTSNNTGDMNLGAKAAQLGAGLSSGAIKPGQVADWIRQNICKK